MRPAEELVDGDAEAPRDQVVEGDVDGRDGACQDAAALEVLAAVHLLPKRADPPRVLADEEFAEVPHRALDGQLAADNARLAPAVVTVVRLDLDDEQVSQPRPNGEGLDVGYLHLRGPNAGAPAIARSRISTQYRIGGQRITGRSRSASPPSMPELFQI